MVRKFTLPGKSKINLTTMKKIFLTACTVALFGIGAMAQVAEDTTSTNNNLQSPTTSETTTDSTSAQDDAGQDDQSGSASGTSVDTLSTSQDTTNTTGSTNGNMGNNETSNMNTTGSSDTTSVSSGETSNMNNSGSGTSQSSGSTNTGTMNQNPSDTTASGTSNQDMGTASASNEPSFGPQVEVLEGKEGPDNQVVYRVNGELYYVDRDKKEMVKVSESDLKDSEHPAVIRQGGNTTPSKK